MLRAGVAAGVLPGRADAEVAVRFGPVGGLTDAGL